MFTYFRDCVSLEDVRKEYHRLTKLHHPDLGGDTATMQAINAEYEQAAAYWERIEQSKREQTNQQEPDNDEEPAVPKATPRGRGKYIKLFVIIGLVAVIGFFAGRYAINQYVISNIYDFSLSGTYVSENRKDNDKMIYVFAGDRLTVYSLGSTNSRTDYALDGYYCAKGLFGRFYGTDSASISADWADSAAILYGNRTSFVHRAADGKYFTSDEINDRFDQDMRIALSGADCIVQFKSPAAAEYQQIELKKVSVPGVADQQMMAVLDGAHKKAFGTYAPEDYTSSIQRMDYNEDMNLTIIFAGIAGLFGVLWAVERLKGRQENVLRIVLKIWEYARISIAYWLAVFAGPAVVNFILRFNLPEESFTYGACVLLCQSFACFLAFLWAESLSDGKHPVCVTINLLVGVSLLSVLIFAEALRANTKMCVALAASLLVTAGCVIKLIVDLRREVKSRQ